MATDHPFWADSFLKGCRIGMAAKREIKMPNTETILASYRMPNQKTFRSNAVEWFL